ncbi:MAG TPA: hypothetical protein VHP37_05640 [Burkholderiales bacterium]|nr:hypothetical protein [Burkholderiales bacterium]
MKRFAAFETPAVTARLGRLTRTEETLRARIAARESEVTARGGWIRTDALHQHLSAILRTVQKAIDDTRAELDRREEIAAPARAANGLSMGA